MSGIDESSGLAVFVGQPVVGQVQVDAVDSIEMWPA